MTALQAIQLFLSTVSGLAVLALSVVVLHHMDLRHGRVFTASSWVLAAYIGGWVALAPWAQPESVPMVATEVAVLVAILGWWNLDAVLWLATEHDAAHTSRFAAVVAVFAATSAAAFAPALTLPSKADAAIRQSDPPAADRRVPQVG